MRPKFLDKTPFGLLGAVFAMFTSEAIENQDAQSAPFPDKIDVDFVDTTVQTSPVLVVDNTTDQVDGPL